MYFLKSKLRIFFYSFYFISLYAHPSVVDKTTFLKHLRIDFRPNTFGREVVKKTRIKQPDKSKIKVDTYVLTHTHLKIKLH